MESAVPPRPQVLADSVNLFFLGQMCSTALSNVLLGICEGLTPPFAALGTCDLGAVLCSYLPFYTHFSFITNCNGLFNFY